MTSSRTRIYTCQYDYTLIYIMPTPFNYIYTCTGRLIECNFTRSMALFYFIFHNGAIHNEEQAV